MWTVRRSVHNAKWYSLLYSHPVPHRTRTDWVLDMGGIVTVASNG